MFILILYNNLFNICPCLEEKLFATWVARNTVESALEALSRVSIIKFNTNLEMDALKAYLSPKDIHDYEISCNRCGSLSDHVQLRCCSKNKLRHRSRRVCRKLLILFIELRAVITNLTFLAS